MAFDVLLQLLFADGFTHFLVGMHVLVNIIVFAKDFMCTFIIAGTVFSLPKSTDVILWIPDFYQAYTSHVGINNYIPLQLSVYPNPATDIIHLTDLDGSIRLINIYNAAGQLVLQQAVNGNPLIEINVTSLSKGFYVGTAIMEGDQTASFKFLK